MSYYIRYFADGVVTLKAIGSGLKQYDPGFKIDGGDVLRGQELLAEIEVIAAGSDMFGEDMAMWLGDVERSGHPNARQLGATLRRAQSIITLHMIDSERDPQVTWEMISPMWSVLPSLSNGVTRMDGQGYFVDGQLVVPAQ
jgi:hypothetical protein